MGAESPFAEGILLPLRLQSLALSLAEHGLEARATLAAGLVVGPEDADDDALYLDTVSLHDAWLHPRIGRLETNPASLLVESLQSRLAAVEQGDDLLAVLGILTAFDHDVIPITQMIVDHAVPAHAEDIHPAAGMEER